MLTEAVRGTWNATPGAANTITTGSFTPLPGELLVALVPVGNPNGITITSVAVTDSVAGTWTKLKEPALGGNGDASIWVKDAGPAPAAQTVTVTALPTTVLNPDVIVLGYGSALPAAAQATQAALNAVSATGTVGQLAITPAQAGSLIVGVLGAFTASLVTVNASTMVFPGPAAAGTNTVAAAGSVVATFKTAGTVMASAGVPVTIGASATKAGGGIVLAEILPAGGFTPAQNRPLPRRNRTQRPRRPIPPAQYPAPFEGWGIPL